MTTAIQFRSKTHVFDGVALVTSRKYSNDLSHNRWFEDVFLYSVEILVPVEFLMRRKLEILKYFKYAVQFEK